MSSPTTIGSELDAIYLYTQLVGAGNDTLPNMDLDDDAHVVPWDSNSAVLKPVEKLEISEVLDEFHQLMGGLGEELKKEHDAGRITGAKYAETYVALTQSALGGAIQFALGKDQAFWAAAKTQADAITSHNANELARMQVALARANFALTKLKLATEDSTFGSSEFTRQYILDSQNKLIKEQMEAQRAQTMTKRSDGTTVVSGVMGAQRQLYEQQKTSYMDDTKVKAARVFSELWTIRKTTDGTIPIPGAFDTAADTTGLANYNSIFGNLAQTAGASDADAGVISDPGNGGDIPVTASGTVLLTVAGAETRNLADPSFLGQRIAIIVNSGSFNCVITAASPLNQTGNNTITMAQVKDMILLQAMKVNDALVWRVIVADGAALSTV